ncbi:hypothetical protein D3Z45_09205 [Lachnospiraceae bacterium]|nr:hypothetical protein [Lachnospiraceae bacterium]
MSVNGITGSSGAADLYGTYKTTSAKTAEKAENKKEESNSGVVYEPSSSANSSTVSKKPDANLVAKLKADSDARIAQMKSLVEQMISKQGQTLGKTDSIWSFLAGGNFTVDAATKAQAQADIADDGYWGVEQTSSRIVDFATALAGSDPKQLEKMRDAFKKGFDNATSTWGKSLPDISQKTYQAVMDKFDKLVAGEE